MLPIMAKIPNSNMAKCSSVFENLQTAVGDPNSEGEAKETDNSWEIRQEGVCSVINGHSQRKTAIRVSSQILDCVA